MTSLPNLTLHRFLVAAGLLWAFVLAIWYGTSGLLAEREVQLPFGAALLLLATAAYAAWSRRWLAARVLSGLLAIATLLPSLYLVGLMPSPVFVLAATFASAQAPRADPSPAA